jgi:hypothetical protein
MPVQKRTNDLRGNIHRIETPGFQPPAEVLYRPNVVTNRPGRISKSLKLLDEIGQNYAKMIASHPAEDSITKNT